MIAAVLSDQLELPSPHLVSTGVSLCLVATVPCNNHVLSF